MAKRVDIPVRIRTDPTALAERAEDLNEALGAAAARALTRAHDERGTTVPAVYQAPVFTWTGSGAHQVTPGQRSHHEGRIVAQLAQAVRAGTPTSGAVVAPVPRARSSGVRTRAGRRPWRGWRTLRSQWFHASVGDYTNYMNDVAKNRTQDFWSLYADMKEQIKWVSMWYVRVDRSYRLSDLTRELSDRALALAKVGANQAGLWSLIHSEADRQQLIAIDRDHVVENVIPDLTSNRSNLVRYHGEVYLRPGGHSVFTLMVLPLIELRSFATTGAAIDITLPIRDLAFLVHPNWFSHFFEVSWEGFLAEVGGQDTTLRVLPLEVTAPVLNATLGELADNQGLTKPADPNSRAKTELRLLSQTTIDALPASVRPTVDGLTSLPTLALDAHAAAHRWEPGWRGAVFSTVLQVTPDHKYAVQHRADANRISDALIGLLRRYDAAIDDGSITRIEWWGDLRRLLRNEFTLHARDDGVRNLFDLVMQTLEAREGGRWFTKLLDVVQSSRGHATRRFIETATASTLYRNHLRIAALRSAYNVASRANLRHSYFPGGEIWLSQDPLRRVPPRGVVADVYSDYSTERTVQHMVESRRAEFETALTTAAHQLLDDIVQGRTSRDFSQEEFSNEAINRAAQAISLTADDFEEDTEITSVRVTNIELTTTAGIERYRVTYNFVKRLEGVSTWTDVEGTSRTVSVGDFEFMLWAWAFGRFGERLEIVGLAIVGIGVLAIAWEVGVIAALVKAAGGTAVVLTSIAISNIIYLATAKHYSVEGFVLATIDGYLFALTFRLGGIGGRAIALRIGTATMPRIVGGWVAQRLVTGTVGGGLGGGAAVFSHGITNVLLHRSRFPSLRDFVHGMTMGALFGLFGEFVIGPALQAAFRVGGATVLNTMAEAVEVIRKSGTSPARYGAEISQALATLRQRLSQFLEEASVQEIMIALRERMATIGESLAAAPGAVGRRLNLAAYRRIFELAEVGLGRVETDGLARLLAVSETGAARMTQERLLTFLNGIASKASHARDCLHAVGRLNDAQLVTVIARGQLDAMAASTRLLNSLRNRNTVLIWEVWTGSSFSLRTAEFETFLARIARRADDQQVFALEAMRRPDQLIAPEGLAHAMEKGGLSNDIVAGLDRLYGALASDAADGIMTAIGAPNTPRYLLFLRSLHQHDVNRLADQGFLPPLSRAPRVLAFASEGNLRLLRVLAAAGGKHPRNVKEVVAGLEKFFTAESALIPAEQLAAVARLRELLARARTKGFGAASSLETAAARARSTAGTGDLARGIDRVAELISGENVHPGVAQEMLRRPPGATVRDIEIGGSPDLLFITPTGVIGREGVSVTVKAVKPARAAIILRDKLVASVAGKVNNYFDPNKAYRTDYVSREIDAHVRLCRDGFNFDPFLDDILIRNVMAEVAKRSPAWLPSIARIRFYGSNGNLVLTWTP